MIASLRLKDFKNFADETLRLGPFTVIVGTNASGKSNIRDAFRFLHGVGRGYTLAEIIDGKYGADWKPIRGSASGIPRFGASTSIWELEVGMHLDLRDARYRIRADSMSLFSGRLRIEAESLTIDSEEVYSEKIFDDEKMSLSRIQPALFQILHRASDYQTYEKPRTVIEEFHRSRFFDFVSDRMREPTSAGQSLGDRGEHLPAVLMNICKDAGRKSILIDWIRELTPMDVEDFVFCDDPSNRIHMVIQEANGQSVSAYAASDGTLRFLAMLAALLDEDSSGLYFFEEIETGLHPSRLHLLVDLIERQTAKGRVQVVATTHSPDLLSMVNDETFRNTALVCRLPDKSDAIIRRIADLPNAEHLRETQELGRLLSGGWMETALAFTEGNGNNGSSE